MSNISNIPSILIREAIPLDIMAHVAKIVEIIVRTKVFFDSTRL